MITVIVPTYNERDNIEPLTERIYKTLNGSTDFEILFIDDSVDDTPEKLEEVSRSNHFVRYIHRENKEGLASAVVLGFNEARGDILAIMDGDLQHPPELLTEMFCEIESGADVVLPSRFVNGGKDEGLNPFRKFVSAIAKYIGKIMLKSMRRISDPTGGYFMIRRSVVVNSELKPMGWKILMEVIVMGDYDKVVEIPYEFAERNEGESKMSMKVTMQYLFHIFSLLLRSEQDRRVITFLLVGMTGMIIDMIIYSVLITIGLHINLAATLSALVAMLNNYLLNRNITWRGERVNKNLMKVDQFLKYLLVSSLGIVIKNIVLALLVYMGLNPIVSNFIGIIAASINNYLFNDRWVFPG